MKSSYWTGLRKTQDFKANAIPLEEGKCNGKLTYERCLKKLNKIKQRY